VRSTHHPDPRPRRGPRPGPPQGGSRRGVPGGVPGPPLRDPPRGPPQGGSQGGSPGGVKKGVPGEGGLTTPRTSSAIRSSFCLKKWSIRGFLTPPWGGQKWPFLAIFGGSPGTPQKPPFLALFGGSRDPPGDPPQTPALLALFCVLEKFFGKINLLVGFFCCIPRRRYRTNRFPTVLSGNRVTHSW